MNKLRIFVIMLLMIGAISVFMFENVNIAKATTIIDSVTTNHDANSGCTYDSINYTTFDSFYFGASYTYQTTLFKKIIVEIRRNNFMNDYWADGSTVLYTSSGNPYSSNSGHKDYVSGNNDTDGVKYSVNGLPFYIFHHSSTILETYYYGSTYDNVLSSWSIYGSR